MQGRAFLELALEILAGDSEVHRRAALGRAYYGLMLECREALLRWGFTPGVRENVHPFVRLRFSYAADADLKTIGRVLDRLVRLRGHADYNLAPQVDFAANAPIQNAITLANNALALLDVIDGDSARRATAIAAVRGAFP